MMRIRSFSNINGFKRALVIAAVSVTMLVACKQEAQSQGSAETRKKFHWEEEQCTGDILVHLGDHLLSVPRAPDTTLTITLEDGTPIRQLHLTQPGYECNVTEIKERAVEVRWAGYEIKKIKEGHDYNGFKGTFGGVEDKIEFAKKEGKIKELPNKVRVVEPDNVIYILPEEGFPTLKGYPIVLACDPQPSEWKEPILGGCRSNYFDIRGFAIYQRISFNKFKPAVAINAVKEKQIFLNKILEQVEK